MNRDVANNNADAAILKDALQTAEDNLKSAQSAYASVAAAAASRGDIDARTIADLTETLNQAKALINAQQGENARLQSRLDAADDDLRNQIKAANLAATGKQNLNDLLQAAQDSIRRIAGEKTDALDNIARLNSEIEKLNRLLQVEREHNATLNGEVKKMRTFNIQQSVTLQHQSDNAYQVAQVFDVSFAQNQVNANKTAGLIRRRAKTQMTNFIQQLKESKAYGAPILRLNATTSGVSLGVNASVNLNDEDLRLRLAQDYAQVFLNIFDQQSAAEFKGASIVTAADLMKALTPEQQNYLNVMQISFLAKRITNFLKNPQDELEALIEWNNNQGDDVMDYFAYQDSFFDKTNQRYSIAGDKGTNLAATVYKHYLNILNVQSSNVSSEITPDLILKLLFKDPNALKKIAAENPVSLSGSSVLANLGNSEQTNTGPQRRQRRGQQ